MRFLKLPPMILIIRYLAALTGVAVFTIVLRWLQPYLAIQLIALIFLLPVLASTVLWGLIPGVLAGFLAFLAFNYFFIPPYHTLRVHQSQDVITLVVFLIVSVVTSQLIGRAREGEKLARMREWEATRMYELISVLAGLLDAQDIARALASHALETFRFDCVEVVIPGQKNASAIAIAPAIAPAAAPEQPPPSAPPSTVLPLLTARGREGELRIWQRREELSAEEMRLLEAYLGQGALALERTRLSSLENKARVLEESDQLKSSLLNSVSHELRSPLAAIKASVSSLRSGAVDWDNNARDDLLATIEEETDHLNLLVGNLLDMSRIESGALQPRRRWNAIAEIAMGVVTRRRSHLHSHQLELDFPDNLPLVPTDYVMVEQVFTNLISNSVKHAPPGSVITIASRKDGDSLHTRVANQGPGVPEQHLRRIFEKFYRVSDDEPITGTGLGLSICKGIIEAHGGKIWAENEPGRFVFHFTLPLTLDGALPETPREAYDG